MTPKETAAWMRIGVDSWSLGWQAARVMGLRAARIAEGGPAAGMEAWLMLAEKWQAAAEIQTELVRGGKATPVAATRRMLAHYRRKIAANGRRLR